MGDFIFLIFIAILGGVSLGINRSLMGIVGKRQGPIEASVINHLSGAIFLVFLVMLAPFSLDTAVFNTIPAFAYAGGVVGAFFVIIISFVLPKIGVLKTSILLISGQILCSTIIDLVSGNLSSITNAFIGVMLILAGVFLGFNKNKQSS